MSTPRQRHEARLRGSSEATREWMRLGLDADSTVDVFGVIERAGVWLLFEPLDRLFGFFQRSGRAAGMVLHSGHPLSLQRFTAAHEYGHYVLGHELSTDSTRELFGTVDVPLQELEAQAFAAEFLMPLQVVNRALDRLATPRLPTSLTPSDAYQLSLEMGSSYTATLTQLHQLNKISSHQLETLRRVRPIDVKADLGGGRRPANVRSDVWLVTDELRRRHLALRVEDELHVRLSEIPTSGYRWEVAFDGLAESLDLVEDGFEPDDLAPSSRLGGTLRRHLWWHASAPADGSIRLRLARPWEGEAAEPADGFSLAFSVDPPRTGLDSVDGVSAPQRRALLRAAG